MYQKNVEQIGSEISIEILLACFIMQAIEKRVQLNQQLRLYCRLFQFDNLKLRHEM